MADINLNEVLPEVLTIGSIDTILYRIGLPLDSEGNGLKRYFRPLFVFAFLSIFLVKELIVLSLSEENDHIFKVLGTLGYLLGLRIHGSLVIILFTTLTLSSQWIYYQNNRNGIKPTFLGVFQMMSGLVTPKS